MHVGHHADCALDHDDDKYVGQEMLENGAQQRIGTFCIAQPYPHDRGVLTHAAAWENVTAGSTKPQNLPSRSFKGTQPTHLTAAV